MSAFIAGTPVAAKVAAKPVARRDATVRAAANSECVPGVATIGMTNTRDVDVIAFSRPTSADAPRPLPPSPHSLTSGLNRRAAVAGVLALFAAAPVRPLDPSPATSARSSPSPNPIRDGSRRVSRKRRGTIDFDAS